MLHLDRRREPGNLCVCLSGIPQSDAPKHRKMTLPMPSSTTPKRGRPA